MVVTTLSSSNLEAIYQGFQMPYFVLPQLSELFVVKVKSLKTKSTNKFTILLQGLQSTESFLNLESQIAERSANKRKSTPSPNARTLISA